MFKHLFLLLCVFSFDVHAGSLNLDLRVDYDSHNYNDAAKAAGGFSNNTNYRLAVGRLDYQGKLNEEVSYRARLRFNQDQAAVNKRDSSNPTLDFAYVANKFSDAFTLTVGKQATMVGGFEGNTTSADVYLSSEAYGGTSILGGTSGVSLQGLNKIHYLTGAQATFNFSEGTQQLFLQSFNDEGVVGIGYGSATGDDLNTGGKLTQTATMNGLAYKGGFLEKTLNVIASYHFENAPGGVDNKVALAALGVESKMQDFTVQLDFLKDDFQIGNAVKAKQSLSSYVLNFKYTVDTLTPMLKLAMSEEQLDKGTTGAVLVDSKNKYSSAALVLEYKPKKDENFRYHAAIYDRTMKPETGDDRHETQGVLGMRIYADFLKN